MVSASIWVLCTASRLFATGSGSVVPFARMETRHRWEGDRVPEGLLRLSVGLEDVDVLWADIENALAEV